MCLCHQNKFVAGQVSESKHNFKQLKMKNVVRSRLYCECFEIRKKNFLTVFSLSRTRYLLNILSISKHSQQHTHRKLLFVQLCSQ